MFRSRFTMAAVFAGLALGACTAADVTAPRSGVVTADAVGDRDNYTSHQPGVVRACAIFGDTEGVGTRLVASAPAGEDVLAGTFEVRPRPYCIEIWNATHDGDVPVTASFVDVDAGWELDFMLVATGDGVTQLSYDRYYGATTRTVTVNRAIGGIIWFKFKPVEPPPPPPPCEVNCEPPPPPPPPQGGQGCTPGYWRQAHHYDSWTAPYTPSTLFSSVFRDAFPGKTLGEVVALGGGGLNALGRHSVAALLNAASSGVSYDLAVERVISAFNTASVGTRNQINDQKDQFEFFNEQGCPLN